MKVEDIDRIKWGLIVVVVFIVAISEFIGAEPLTHQVFHTLILMGVTLPFVLWAFGQIKKLTLELERHSEELETMVSERTKELEKAYTEVKRLSDTKDELLTAVSHELKTPLTTIRGCIDLLSDTTTPEEMGELISMAEGESNRLQALIDDLVDVSTVSKTTRKVTLKSLSLGKLVKELIEEVAPIAKEKNIRIESDIRDVEVVGDKQLLKRAILNVLNNAVKFTKENGTVNLSTRREESEVKISVSDTGVGIPLEAMDKIFNKFYRVERGDAKLHYGAGLGLTVTKAIVDTHGGEIKVDSVLGKGSTFTILLPLKENT